MKMQKLFIIFSLLGLQLSFAPAITAQTVTGTQNDRMMRKDARISAAQERKDDRITTAKARADQEIDRRIAALNKLVSEIGLMKKLTSSQKSTLTNQLQTEISNLTSLKSKIDADTDTATLKTDIQSIVKSYRVFALFLPRIQVLAAADRLAVTADATATLSAKLQTRIQEAQSKGKDVSLLQTSLSDMNAKITDAKTQAQNAQNAVLPLSPTDYPGNKGILLSARKMIQTGHGDLVKAQQDAKSIILGLKSIATPTTLSPTQ